MKIQVRKGYVFFKGAHAYPGGTELEVTDEEYKVQHWKAEPVLETKMVTDKVVLNRNMRSAETK